MNTLHLFLESLTNGYRGAALTLIDTVSIALAISVIISKNPIVSVLFLIGLFVGIALHLIVSGLSFIGLSYLLVYVGAVSILFLFILMLINIRISELLSDASNIIPLALIVALSFNYPVFQVLPYNVHNDLSIDDDLKANSLKTYFAISKLWDGSLSESTHISSIGNIMYSSYSIWLIITSIILLLAMVGAIVITIKQSSSYDSQKSGFSCSALLDLAVQNKQNTTSSSLRRIASDVNISFHAKAIIGPNIAITDLFECFVNATNYVLNFVVVFCLHVYNNLCKNAKYTIEKIFYVYALFSNTLQQYPSLFVAERLLKVILFIVVYTMCLNDLHFTVVCCAFISSITLFKYIHNNLIFSINHPLLSKFLEIVCLIVFMYTALVIIDVSTLKLLNLLHQIYSIFNCRGDIKGTNKASPYRGEPKKTPKGPQGPKGPQDPYGAVPAGNSGKRHDEDETNEKEFAPENPSIPAKLIAKAMPRKSRDYIAEQRRLREKECKDRQIKQEADKRMERINRKIKQEADKRMKQMDRKIKRKARNRMEYMTRYGGTGKYTPRHDLDLPYYPGHPHDLPAPVYSRRSKLDTDPCNYENCKVE